MSLKEASSLRDRVILAAGGSGGLGRATVELLAREGASVVVGYRRNRERAESLKAELEARFSARIHLVEGDLKEAAARKRWVEAAGAVEGGLYGLVVFTGVPARVKLDDLTQEAMHASFLENYSAPVLLAREAAAAMRRSRVEGSIVLISSMQGLAPFESSLNYAGPKAALVHAARVLAKEWGGPGGIRVNAVAPGVNEAGMALASIRAGKYDVYVESGIIPRFGSPLDVARAVRLFLEPDNYITGQVLAVDGGLTLRRDRG